MPVLTLADIQNALAEKGERPAILLYANAVPRLGTYIPIARAMRAAGYVCVLAVPEAMEADLAETPDLGDLPLAAIPPGQVRKLSGLDLFVSAEFQPGIAPAGTRRMVIWHSLPDKEGRVQQSLVRMIERKLWLSGELDYLFVALRQDPEDWQPGKYAPIFDRVVPAQMLSGRPDRVVLLPGGYPKIDAVEAAAAEAEARHGPPDRILYCPTQTNQTHSAVERHGAGILSTLLEALPRYKVVFRPYPSGDREKLRPLADRFASEPRFLYDLSTTGEEHSVRSAFVITDGSSAAVTYSLATLRPSIHFRPDRQLLASRDFDPIGVYARNLRELRRAAERFSADPACLRERIAEGRERFVYNPGRSIAYLVECIPDLVAGRIRPDWLDVPRRPWSGTAEAAKAHLRALAQRPQTGGPADAKSNERYRQRIETLLGTL